MSLHFLCFLYILVWEITVTNSTLLPLVLERGSIIIPTTQRRSRSLISERKTFFESEKASQLNYGISKVWMGKLS